MRFQRIEIFSKFIFICAIFLLFSSSLYSGTFNRKFSKNSSSENGGLKYCSTCHTPISDYSNISEPLWLGEKISHEFKTYSSDNNSNLHGFPSGKTKLCLGCHDGIVAVEDKNVYKNSNKLKMSGRMGGTSHNAHPLSIVYDSYLTLTNEDLADPSSEPSGLGGTIEEDLLENGRIVCTSCHAMHPMMGNDNSSSNHFNSSGNRGSMPLKISNEGSKLCLTCHKK